MTKAVVPLVIMRCKDCRRWLGSLDVMPTDWSGVLTFNNCPVCVVPDSRRFIGVLISRGMAGFPIHLMMPLADLRDAALKARRLGRPESVDVAALPGRENFDAVE